jgi:hypothetical protein
VGLHALEARRGRSAGVLAGALFVGILGGCAAFCIPAVTAAKGAQDPSAAIDATRTGPFASDPIREYAFLPPERIHRIRPHERCICFNVFTNSSASSVQPLRTRQAAQSHRSCRAVHFLSGLRLVLAN